MADVEPGSFVDEQWLLDLSAKRLYRWWTILRRKSGYGMLQTGVLRGIR